MTLFIIAYHISLVNVQTNYSNNNLLTLDVKQLNKIMKLYYFYTLKHCRIATVKLRCVMEYPGLKSSYREKSQVLHGCHLRWNSYSKNLILNSCTLSIFPGLEIKKLVLVGKLLWRFDVVFHIWLMHLFFLVMINIYTKWSKFCTRKC